MGWTASIACGPRPATRGDRGDGLRDRRQPGAPSARAPLPAVVVVGAAARDLVDDDPRGWRLGGGVSYSALTTARLGLPTGAIIGVDDAAAASDEIELLRDAGVDVRLVPLEHGPGLRQHRAARGPPPALRGPLRPDPGRGRSRRVARRPGLDPRPGRRRAAAGLGRPAAGRRLRRRSAGRASCASSCRASRPGTCAPAPRPDRQAGEPRRPVPGRRRPGHGRWPTSTRSSTAARRWR